MCECIALDLTHPLAADLQLAADLLQRGRLAVAVGADRLVQRHRCLDGAERLLDVAQLETRRVGELLLRRLLAARGLEPLAGTVELYAPLVDVRRDTDRRGLVRDRTLAGLADPPGGVGRELEALAPVELLDGAVQSDHALLDQVAELQAVALVALGDRDHQAQVRVDHPLLRRGVTALDALREGDLLRRREQRVAAGLVHEEREAVGRTRDGRVDGTLRRLGMRGRDQLDATLLQLGAESGDLLVLELVLVDIGLEGLFLELALLLSLVEEGAGFQFSKLG